MSRLGFASPGDMVRRVRAARETLARGGAVAYDWCTVWRGTDQLDRWFMDCLQAKISAHDKRRGRKLSTAWQTCCERDARRLNQPRLAIHYIDTPELKDRFAHRLSED